MRFKTFLAGALAVLSTCGLPSTPVKAQSFLQSLFGYSKPAPRSPSAVSARRPNAVPRTYANGSKRPRHFGLYMSTRQMSRRRATTSGSYRTLCVRTCDGYYFPISAATSRSYFHKDAGICRSRCGAPAQLFYMPRRSTDVARARDLEGRSYNDLENAFKYRKTLVNGCACRAMPWSSAERARHRRYDYMEAVQASYKLAEARAKKRRDDEAARIEKERTAALAAQKENDTQTGQDGQDASSVQAATLLLKDSSGFQYRWITVSKLFAAPGSAAARKPTPSVNVASVDTYDYITAGDPSYSQPAPAMVSHQKSRQHSIRANRPGTSANKKRRKKKKQSGSVFSGLFGQQKSKYSWPGD